jgi:type IV pilus assembly protein PilC
MLKEVIYEIANDVDSGFSLSQALEKHKSVFSDFYINMTKSAEVTGRLSETLGFLADYLERQAIMMGKVKNALSYPVFIVVLFIVVVIVMVIVVFPKLTAIFEESSAELPVLTKFLISFSSFLSSWWWTLLIIFGVFFVVLLNYFRTAEGAAVKDELKLKLPIFGKIFSKLYISRFSEGARVLIKGGLTIPQAVEISSRTIGNVVYYEVLRRAAEDIRRGKLLSQALAERPEFPPLVSQLISVGESTGRMEELLEKINSFYTREVDDALNNIVSLIQPALMVVIGGMIALLFAAILLPLYSITQTF